MSKLSQEIKECVSCPQINGKPYGRWGALNSQQRINIWNLAEQCEFYEELADKSMEKLTKYKRAFEILKEIFDIRFEKDAFGDCWIKIFPTTYDDRHILGEPTKEQYELLEELMKGE